MRQQLGWFVGEVVIAERVGFNLVAHVRHLDEISGIRRVNCCWDDNLVDRECGHESDSLGRDVGERESAKPIRIQPRELRENGSNRTVAIDPSRRRIPVP